MQADLMIRAADMLLGSGLSLIAAAAAMAGGPKRLLMDMRDAFRGRHHNEGKKETD